MALEEGFRKRLEEDASSDLHTHLLSIVLGPEEGERKAVRPVAEGEVGKKEGRWCVSSSFI